MIVSSEGSDYKPIPAGSYVATCVRIIDQGTQTSTYQGQEKAQRKVLITWEVPEHEVEDQHGEIMPALISAGYTASLHEKASLRKALESWRGVAFTADELKGFDLANVLGQPCMISVVHTEKDGRTYANVASVMRLPKGMPKPAVVHDKLNFDLDNFSQAAWDRLSDKQREKIKASPEYRAATEPGYSDGQQASSAGYDLDDEIPF